MIDIQTNIFTLSKQDTNVMKGIAIIAMLCHHVYTCLPSWIEPYPMFLTTLGVLGKICVAMFLFCSGYGLAVQYDKTMVLSSSLKNKLRATIIFIIKRMVKFYSAYWFVFLIFVPITILFFNRPLSAAYGGNVNIWQGLLFDILGINGFHSYNITWWFNRLIIIFYFAFPILYALIKKTKWITLLVCFIVMCFANKLGSINYYSIMLWQLPFVLGIGWQIYQDKMGCLSKYLRKYSVWSTIGVIVVLILGVLQRLYNIVPIGNISHVRFDGILTILILMVVIVIIRKLKYTYLILTFFGKHSINIYLIHTFLNGYWTPVRKFLHTSEFCRYGGVNMWILLLICLIISIVLEYLKDKLYWNKLTEKIVVNIK